MTNSEYNIEVIGFWFYGMPRHNSDKATLYGGIEVFTMLKADHECYSHFTRREADLLYVCDLGSNISRLKSWDTILYTNTILIEDNTRYAHSRKFLNKAKEAGLLIKLAKDTEVIEDE
jgi:hypothetical protein